MTKFLTLAKGFQLPALRPFHTWETIGFPKVVEARAYYFHQLPQSGRITGKAPKLLGFCFHPSFHLLPRRFHLYSYFGEFQWKQKWKPEGYGPGVPIARSADRYLPDVKFAPCLVQPRGRCQRRNDHRSYGHAPPLHVIGHVPSVVAEARCSSPRRAPCRHRLILRPMAAGPFQPSRMR
jgi:hypothetical protein